MRLPLFVYRVLLRLFPPSFRARFGDEMAVTFCARLQAARARGFLAVMAFWMRSVVDVIRHGLAERRASGSAGSTGSTGSAKVLQDVRYGARYLVRRPAFTTVAVLTLALGIGANTAIFSVVRSVLLAPLPYTDVERLVVIWHPANDVTHLSLREVLSYRDEAHGFARVSGYTETALDFTGTGGEPERVRGAAVMPDLFTTLGVAPVSGRLFSDDDATPGAVPVVAISHRLWQRRFNGNAAIVGQSVLVNGRAATVVAVMPDGFRLPRDFQSDRPSDAWIPISINPGNLGGWGNRSLIGVGRLDDGVTHAAAGAALFDVGRRWIAAGFVQDDGDGRFQRQAIPVREFVVGEVRAPMLVLAGAVAIVLLIACANVVNLLLAQNEMRRRDIAVQVALGAQRRDIARQLLVEAMLLAGAGGAAGVGLAVAGTRALIAIRPAFMPRVADAGLDMMVLCFTAGLSVLAAVPVGAAPAWTVSRGAANGVALGIRGAGARRLRAGTRQALVVVQLAAAVMLVIAAGLLVRTLLALTSRDLGFDPRGVITAQVQLPASTYPRAEDIVSFYDTALERLRALPGVVSAGAIRLLPLTRTIGNWSITVENAPRRPNENPNGDFQWATPGYFETMRTRLVRGRFFTSADTGAAPLVAVINETMAERYWPGQDALDKRFKMGTGDTPWVTVVGILSRTHHNSYVEAPRAEMYLPHAQLPRSVGGAARAMALVVRTENDPQTLAAPLRDVIRNLDAQLPVSDVKTLEQIAREALSETRFAALLLGLFAALALTLAAVGVYGTLSVLVSERAPEIGIRMALGADRRAIVRMVVREGGMLTVAGCAIGLAGAALAATALRSMTHDVSVHDPLTFALVPVVLAVVGLAACMRPALRAAATDPTRVMR